MLKTATVCFLQYVCIAYAILKTTPLETGHRFALGHNLGVPAPGCDLAVYRRQKGPAGLLLEPLWKQSGMDTAGL